MLKSEITTYQKVLLNCRTEIDKKWQKLRAIKRGCTPIRRREIQIEQAALLEEDSKLIQRLKASGFKY